MDSSSLDEVIQIPNTLMVYGGCPQNYLFPGSPVYRFLVHMNYWSENIFLEGFLLQYDKELAGIPSSVGSFSLASYPSKTWEIFSVFFIGHNTFELS